MRKMNMIAGAIVFVIGMAGLVMTLKQAFRNPNPNVAGDDGDGPPIALLFVGAPSIALVVTGVYLFSRRT